MNKRAFTLFESLLVLICLSIMFLLVEPSMYRGLSQGIEEMIFTEKLIQNLSYAQQKAILQNNSVEVTMDRANRQIIFNDNASKSRYRIMKLPDHLNLLETFSIVYKNTGRIGYFKPIRFIDINNQERFEITLQLGSGQFEVKK